MPELQPRSQIEPVVHPAEKPDYSLAYAEADDGEFRWPAINYAAVNPDYLRQEVDYATNEPPGTIVVEPRIRFCISFSGTGVPFGTGEPGGAGARMEGARDHSMEAKVPDMDADAFNDQSQSETRTVEAGHAARCEQPARSRALYIFQDGEDTRYRIHGSPEWQSIGKNASSGCVRMFNQDAIDLYERVRGKARLLVK